VPEPGVAMHVVATAGHVDHGKSTLVRALTGMEPDRWAEERRRGMTIDLGYAWTALPDGPTIAFVDVPGHERFVPTMLAGVVPVPAVVLVVAADEGWMPQTAEHVAALDALGVRHGLVAVTRADLADPRPVLDDVRHRLGRTALRDAPGVALSAVTGEGLPAVRAALAALVARLPAADDAAAVRLWIDRAFTVRGSGTVVTGTLGAGTLRPGDELELHTGQGCRPVRIRALQALGRPADRLTGVARVGVNLRGADRQQVARGDALLTPGRWRGGTVLDVRFAPGEGVETVALPAGASLHLGSAVTPARPRLLGRATGGETFLRLTLGRPLPVAPGDLALLRDPGRHLVLGRVTVLAVDPDPLRRRGAAAARAADLAGLLRGAAAGRPDGDALLRRHGVLRADAFTATGATVPPGAVRAGAWVVDGGLAGQLRDRVAAAVADHRRAAPLDAGPTVEQVRRRLALPDGAIVTGLVHPPLVTRDGRVVDLTAPPPLPAAITSAVRTLVEELARRPFLAPEADRLQQLGLGPRELAAAERAGALLRLGESLVLLPGDDVRAARALAALPQPFTLSQARQALGTTRRVAVPLLELLDRRRLTRRLPDDRRVLPPNPG
jgi:selenocysteine-specific elongation factor